MKAVSFLVLLLATAFRPAPVRARDSIATAPAAREDGAREKSAPDENRKRWERLPPEARLRIEKLYERLKELRPEERRRLIEQLRSLDPARRRDLLRRAKDAAGKDSIDRDIDRDTDRERRRFIQNQLRGLPPEEKASLERLAPVERRRFGGGKREERRKSMVSRLPLPLREKVAEMSPRERLHFLQRWNGERAFKETFTDPLEVEKIRVLPPRRVMEALKATEGVEPDRRPEWLSEDTWRRWLVLKPYERPRALRHLLGPRLEGPTPRGPRGEDPPHGPLAPKPKGEKSF
jgi:hypothetical protein